MISHKSMLYWYSQNLSVIRALRYESSWLVENIGGAFCTRIIHYSLLSSCCVSVLWQLNGDCCMSQLSSNGMQHCKKPALGPDWLSWIRKRVLPLIHRPIQFSHQVQVGTIIRKVSSCRCWHDIGNPLSINHTSVNQSASCFPCQLPLIVMSPVCATANTHFSTLTLSRVGHTLYKHIYI